MKLLDIPFLPTYPTFIPSLHNRETLPVCGENSGQNQQAFARLELSHGAKPFRRSR